MKQLSNIINDLFSRFSLVQRLVIIVVFIGMLSAIISLVIWANRPEYALLYADLEPSAASKIVSDLRSMKITYKLDHSGQKISVPAKDVSELRLKFTESGYVGNSIAGYEVFDDAKIGMTSFMQQLNMRRALEGELIKTINQFPGVKNSRVHFVLPEGKLFKEDEKGTASVVLYLKKGMYISEDQVKGIVALVSNSVKGIDPENVVVVDTEGKLLSETQENEASLGSARSQWDLQKSIEYNLQKKVLRIVEGIVGNRNAVVEVSADLDFEKIERTVEAFDPDNVVVVSEERHSETSSGEDPSRFNSEDVITNFELNKTVEHFISSAGTVKKVSVAVLINEKVEPFTNESGEEVGKHVPRSSEELQQIARLVQSAVGYNEDRGDVVEVKNMKFDKSDTQVDKEYFAQAEKREMIMAGISKSLIGIGILIAFFIVRRLLENTGTTRLQLQSSNGMGAINSNNIQVLSEDSGEDDLPLDNYMRKLSPEARAKIKAKDVMTEKVISYAKDKPEETAKLLRHWLIKAK